jgi:hypothetical protein
VSPTRRYWDEATNLLAKHEGSLTKAHRSLIGKWASQSGNEYLALLELMDAAKDTGDPIPYLQAAVDRRWPPKLKPVHPKTFTEGKWRACQQVAINRRTWAKEWGPPPGGRGCLMPAEFVTAELLAIFKPEGALV